MTSRALAFASLLMIAAIAPESTMAAELGVPAYAGHNLDVTTSNGPLVLPGLATPSPTPELEQGSANRDLVALDFAGLLDSYASVSHSADGTTTVTPASAALRAILEQEYAAGRI